MLAPIQNIKLADQDNTSVQGFEPLDKNVIVIDPGDCPHCLKPFNGRGTQSTIINVFTNYGKEQWCAECVGKGVKEGICVQESKLNKVDKKIWEKHLKKNNK